MPILINTFHNTEYKTSSTRKYLNELEMKYVHGGLSPKEKQLICRIRKKLCGIEGCTCGNFIGERN